MSCYVHGMNHVTNCEPSVIPNARSHIVKNFMVLSLAWRWLFKSKHVALICAFIIQLCWLEHISIKWIYRPDKDYIALVNRHFTKDMVSLHKAVWNVIALIQISCGKIYRYIQRWVYLNWAQCTTSILHTVIKIH